MSNSSGMEQYVRSAGESLNVSNYNELDALVFAELSNLKFEECNVTPSDSYTVKDYVELILKTDGKLTADKRALLTEIAGSPRYQNCTVRNMQADNVDTQWAAITIDFNDGSNSSTIAMRATDGSYEGWHEDFELAYDPDGTKAQHLSSDYLNKCDSEHIYMTGHSKGGNDCTSAYMMADKDVRDRVVHIDNYDGPGVHDRFRDDHLEAYKELDGKLDNYYPKDSIIGQLLNNNPGKSHFVDAEVRETYKDHGILGEHDPYSFKTDGDGFKSAEQSEISKYVDELLDKSIDDLTYEERQDLVRFLDKYGVFHMIANEDNPFSLTKKSVKETLENIEDLNILNDDTLKLLKKYSLPLANILIAVIIYNNMSKEEKDAAIKAITSLLFHVAVIAGREKLEDVMEEVDKLKEQFIKKYEEVASWIEDKYNDAKKTIWAINEGVKREVEKIRAKWEDRLNRIVREIRRAAGNGEGIQGIISINPPRINHIHDTLISISEQLKNHENEVENILTGLPSMGIPVELVKKVKDSYDTTRAGSLHNKCKNYGKTFREIMNTYERAEKEISNVAKIF